MGVVKFIVRRLLFGVLTLFIVSVAVFALTQALSDPAQAILGRDALPAALAAKRQELGLDRPVLTQYWDWISGLLTGDPGVSFTNGVPVLDVLGDRVWNSLFLMAISAAISIPLSITVGTYAAARRDKAFDSTSSGTSLLLASMPDFVLGLLLVVLLATNVWHIFPAVTRIRPGERPWSDPDGLVLPVLTLTLVVVPYVSRVMRASMIEVLESDYVEMARLKGLPERAVLWRHALPNAIGPTLQVVAFNIAYLAGGVILIEYLFNYPGIGGALRDAVTDRNVPVVQFIAMFISGIWVVVNLLADVGTVLVTPRLRTQLA
ncbi:MAG: ABC transporter permease [Actinomycetota bacterium]|nr:ABC transporter permease [Acidimicrobiia bacterium]MDQ3469537.1 ABC transporter permease [Actinomycetota bacterium]